MRRLLIALFLFISGSISTYAQAADRTIPESISNTAEQALPDIDTRFTVTEVTREESVFNSGVFLRQIDAEGHAGNVAQLTQVGDQNLTVLTQYGQQNIISIRLTGDQNRVEALQEGIGNRLGVSVLGSYNTIPVTQMGGAELSLELIDVNNLDLRPGIEQIGSGVPLMIQITPNATP